LFKFIVVLIFTKYLKLAKQNGNFGNIELDFQYMNNKVPITMYICDSILWDMIKSHALSENISFLMNIETVHKITIRI